MQRRTLLRRTGALGALALAGCTGETGADGTPGTDTPTDTPTATPTDTPTATPTDTPSPTPGKPTVGEASLTVTDVTSGEQIDEADVSFDTDAGTVRVEGTIWGSDGCKTAELGTVEYDAGGNTLRVAVVTTDREDTDDRACTQAIVEIDYRVRVAFSGGPPGTVEVSHDDRPVASADRAVDG